MNLDSTFADARRASASLLALDNATVDLLLLAIADAAVERCDYILSQNALDLERMSPDDPRYDRLRLTADRIRAIAADLRNVAMLPSPLVDIEHRVLANGLQLTKRAVPFGVIGVIYESRPNVCFDVASLCLKSGNVCVLKGGADADYSDRAIVAVIGDVLDRFGVDRAAVTLLPASREAATALLQARGMVDLIIPRGSASLIAYVRDNARVPVIETGAGVCHTYFDASADVAMGSAIINNAKTRRVSVCNALDCLLVNRSRLADLPVLCSMLAEAGVTIYADDESYAVLRDGYPSHLLAEADEHTFGTEFLSLAMAVKTVTDTAEAVKHIACYGSGHSECIITSDDESAAMFTSLVDAACVYVNAPTSFTDGAQFGLGAEVGISTQKLHARGPMALREITTYKWIVRGNGQTRPA